MGERFKIWVQKLRAEMLAIWLVAHHPQTPWGVKLLAVLVAAYAFSPIDLIPDFIPVIGLLDDFVLLPIGLWLVLQLVPDQVMAASRAEAARRLEKPVSVLGALLVVIVWVSLAVWAYFLMPK